MIRKIRPAVMLSLLVVSFLYIEDLNAQVVDIEITNIRNDKGSILLGVFTDHEGFAEEEAIIDIILSKEKMENGNLKLILELEPGTYGISVLDDENDNGEMDYNFLGIPKEGFGFSNYLHTALRRPVFENFKFDLSGSQRRKKILIKMTYYF